MDFIKTIAAAAVSLALLTGCNDDSNTTEQTTNTSVRFGTYNLSFDRYSYEELVEELQITSTEQTALMTKWFSGDLTDDELETVEKVIQIKNVAAIIQSERPAVLMMAEFNNDGTGDDKDALTGFQTNYLSVSQNALGATSSEEQLLDPIEFGYSESFATNTGLLSDYDLDHNGSIELPSDAWGFGYYHGQYAFGLLSQYPIDTDNIRTFQTFKWKDMPGESNPTVTNCEDEANPIPEGLSCGDNWYTDEAWAEKPLSSKNHVDAPIIIPTANGDKTIHLLLSHPTPPVFDTVTENNKLLNSAEINFWNDYISNSDYIYDDNGVTGGLDEEASFVVMGDLNADPESGDGYLATIQTLISHERVNTTATTGTHVPTSLGASECVDNGDCDDTTYPERITSTFSLRVDYVIPSTDMEVNDSSVFWPASYENGRLLVNDERVGSSGTGKDLSSDHRLVWIDTNI